MDQADSLRQLVAEQGRKYPLRVIAVTSGKGGVGKSNIAANLAVVAAKSGQRVLVLDADLGLANVEILYGLRPRYHLGHLLEGSVPLEQILAVGPAGVRVLPAGSGLQELTKLDEAQRLRVVTALDELTDDVDLLLIDTGAGIGDNVLFFSGAAQESLLIVTTEATSLTDAYASVKVLTQQAGVSNFAIVVNQAPNEATARDVFEKLSKVTARFLSAKTRYLGWIPRDENLHRAVLAQRPLVELFPQSPSARAITALCSRLLDEPPSAELHGGLKFLWQRLMRESRAEVG